MNNFMSIIKHLGEMSKFFEKHSLPRWQEREVFSKEADTCEKEADACQQTCILPARTL